MKKYLLSNEGDFYKANLHVHTTVSDGLFTPEEVKQGYKEHGYSVVAFTDHEVFAPHNDLTDDEFVAINSVEVSINDNWPASFNHNKTYHLNLYALSDKKTECVACTGSSVWLEQSKKYISEFSKNNNFYKNYSINDINFLIEKSNKDGFIVCYNHPVWSLQNYEDYAELKGLWGVEVYNSGCFRSGYEDTAQPFEDLLRKNEKLLPVCADDAHNLNTSAYGGWTMIKAPALNYNAILTALKNGDIYSSTGPEINELYIENGIVTIKTSNVKRIKLVTDIRYTKCEHAVEGEYINEASFDISSFIQEAQNKEINRRSLAWFRLEIIDESGKRAYTKGYFLNEIL